MCKKFLPYPDTAVVRSPIHFMSPQLSALYLILTLLEEDPHLIIQQVLGEYI